MIAGVTVDARDLSGPEQEYEVDARHNSGTSSITHPEESPGPDPKSSPTDRPELGGALEALSGEVLKRRSLEVSSTSFITIISIILGVALALLAQNTFPSPSPLVGLRSACMLALFVCTFYYFLSISILLRWAPSIVDCSMPFVIASLEIPPAYFLNDVKSWNAWLAVLWVFVAIGVGTTIKWSPASHFGGDTQAQQLVHKLIRELTVVITGGALSVGTFGLLALFVRGGDIWWGLGGCGSALATIGMIIARMEIRLSQIHAHYGVNRPPFN